MFCNDRICQFDSNWRTDDHVVYLDEERIFSRTYTCRNCGRSTQQYSFIWYEQAQGDLNLFMKVGQYPALSINPSPELEKALGPEDSGLYTKGLIEFNFAHGIGSVAYFRRVLENKINALLDLIAEAAKNEGADEETLKKIESVKASHRVEDKIEMASQALPKHLKPGGHDPFDKLYSVLSAGLHGESDDECLTISGDAKFRIEYLFKNLTENNEEARRYVKELSAPPKQKAAPSAEPKAASPSVDER
jgi:hypothetical protein